MLKRLSAFALALGMMSGANVSAAPYTLSFTYQTLQVNYEVNGLTTQDFTPQTFSGQVTWDVQRAESKESFSPGDVPMAPYFYANANTNRGCFNFVNGVCASGFNGNEQPVVIDYKVKTPFGELVRNQTTQTYDQSGRQNRFFPDQNESWYGVWSGQQGTNVFGDLTAAHRSVYSARSFDISVVSAGDIFAGQFEDFNLPLILSGVPSGQRNFSIGGVERSVNCFGTTGCASDLSAGFAVVGTLLTATLSPGLGGSLDIQPAPIVIPLPSTVLILLAGLPLLGAFSTARRRTVLSR